MDIKVLNSDGSAGSSVSASDKNFGAEFNEALVHQVVVAYQAGGRSGTRAQKNRSAVRGGGVKPFRQKGTGRARAGTIRSPIWRGGGKIFPASTQDFSQKVNRKMYRGAIRSILSELVREERFCVVGDFGLSEPKTKALADKLAPFGNDVLIISDEQDQALELSARNIPHVEVCEASKIDPVSLIRHERVVVTEAGLKKIEEWLQ